MTILQFLRIVWARRLLIGAAAVSCVLGGVIVGLVLPPRWEAHTHVLLNLLKPDPVSGQINTGSELNPYIRTQVEIVRDYAVAGKVVDELGWLTDPALIERYQRRPKTDTRDFHHWLAQQIIDGTKTQIVAGSAILDISYTATTPTAAKTVADALRKAYIDASVGFSREDAARDSQWYAAQAQQAKAALDVAEAAKDAFERQNNIVLQDNKLDVESARLEALAGAAAAPVAAARQAPQSSPAALELAQVDAQIAEDSKVLGPNHPELQALEAKKAAVQTELARERSASTVKAAASNDSAALERELSAQKARVIGDHDKIARLKQLQAEIDIRRDQYDKTAARAAELHQDADIANVGLTPLGAASVPKSPKFPNWLLIIPGSLGLGFATGTLAALLTELLGRRVRGREDLQASVDIPVIAVLSAPPRSRRPVVRPRERSAPARARRSIRA